MFEVHTGGRPGRPVLLLVLCAVALVGSLGIAWTQSQRLRELAPEQQIPDTPLVVRPPPHWLSTEAEPHIFRLLREGRTLMGRPWRTERAVRYGYRRLRGETDLATAVARYELGGAAPPDKPIACKLAGHAAYEFRLTRHVIGAGLEERALRATLTPARELIVVEYLPSERMSAREVLLMDDICRAVRIDPAGAKPMRPVRLP